MSRNVGGRSSKNLYRDVFRDLFERSLNHLEIRKTNPSVRPASSSILRPRHEATRPTVELHPLEFGVLCKIKVPG